MNQPNVYSSIFCGIYWFILFVIYFYKVNSKPINTKPNLKGYLVFGILVTVYSVFEFTGGDFYNYKLLYDNYHFYGTTSHLEPVYEFFIDISGQSYYVWRLIVWSIATIIWTLVVKKLKLDVQYSALVFLLVVFFHFVGARQSIGFGLLYLGLTFSLSQSKNRSAYSLLGFGIICSSLVFHKTMIVYIIITLLSLMPVRRKGIIITLILFPIIYRYWDLLIGNFVQYLEVYSEDTSDVFQRYLDSDFQVSANFKGILRLTIERMPILCILFYALYKVFLKNQRLPYFYEVLLRSSYIMIYVSFLFMGRDVSAYISPRFWDASLFPLTLFVAYYLFPIRKKTIIKLFVVLLLVAKLFLICYNIYRYS